MMTFHQWKDRQVKADSEKHGVFRYYRDRECYCQAYGRYAARAALENKHD